MKIKTYRSESVPKALEQIKKELGPGAVILNTRRTTQRRFLGLIPSLAYEITAAADPTGGKNLPPERKTPEQRMTESYEIATQDVNRLKGEPPARPYRHSPKGQAHGDLRRLTSDHLGVQIERISADISRLRQLVARQNPIYLESLPFLRNHLLHETFQQLIGHGLDESLAVSLVRVAARRIPPGQDARDRLNRRLNKVLARRIQTSPIEHAGVLKTAVFIGPTGVGKTTTIAKLAAHFALGEQKKVQLITLDTYRIAAAEQMKVYGEIIGVPVRVVFSVPELQESVVEARDRDVILIDTTGHSPQKVDEFEELASYLRETPEIEKHLVLSTTTKPWDLTEIIQSFGAFAPDKLVFTKLDESSTFGAIANELIRTGKPLSYLTNGQRVPEDLIVATPRSVSDLLVPLSEELVHA